jgi:hypothetical protein
VINFYFFSSHLIDLFLVWLRLILITGGPYLRHSRTNSVPIRDVQQLHYSCYVLSHSISVNVIFYLIKTLLILQQRDTI